MELRVDDIVNIGIGIPEMVSRHARKNGMLDMVTLTVESGGIGGFPVSGQAFGAMIGAASVYDMANQFDLYNNGGQTGKCKRSPGPGGLCRHWRLCKHHSQNTHCGILHDL